MWDVKRIYNNLFLIRIVRFTLTMWDVKFTTSTNEYLKYAIGFTLTMWDVKL